MSSASISAELLECLKAFNTLLASDKLAETTSSGIPRYAWNDELGRLRIWSANIGAHQKGQSSLDYRLRDASHIQTQIVKLLQSLKRTIHDLDEVLTELSGVRPNIATGGHAVHKDDVKIETKIENDDEDDDSDALSEVAEIFNDLAEIITNLYRMSILVRQPARQDRFLRYRKDDALGFEPFDRNHVQDKFPKANSAVVDRLGAAISNRRRDLKALERHRAKLAKGINHAHLDQHDGVSTVISGTLATTYEEDPLARLDSESMSGESTTSYAASFLAGRGNITVPPPPNGYGNEEPFECPYCFFITTTNSRTSWARHVFRDLMPYLCTFPECSTPNKIYDRRRDWFLHLRKDHLQNFSATSTTTCHLCQKPDLTYSSLERHLGAHLEELALFALPRHIEDDKDDGSVEGEPKPSSPLVDSLVREEFKNLQFEPSDTSIDSDADASHIGDATEKSQVVLPTEGDVNIYAGTALAFEDYEDFTDYTFTYPTSGNYSYTSPKDLLLQDSLESRGRNQAHSDGAFRERAISADGSLQPRQDASQPRDISFKDPVSPSDLKSFFEGASIYGREAPQDRRLYCATCNASFLDQDEFETHYYSMHSRFSAHNAHTELRGKRPLDAAESASRAPGANVSSSINSGTDAPREVIRPTFYYCKSPGCVKIYKLRGDYQKHVQKWHPEMLSQEPSQELRGYTENDLLDSEGLEQTLLPDSQQANTIRLPDSVHADSTQALASPTLSDFADAESLTSDDKWDRVHAEAREYIARQKPRSKSRSTSPSPYTRTSPSPGSEERDGKASRSARRPSLGATKYQIVDSGSESSDELYVVEAGPIQSQDQPPPYVQGKGKGILKPPRETPFPENPSEERDEAALLKEDTTKEIPPNARWTKISRALVNPQTLEEAGERFEERDDYVIVLRPVPRDQIVKWAARTKEIRGT